ncbi:periplasmic binding protein-like I [Globomyces pollinis-pini]|nr:periplasmic binding protein-like I [Globomyces pollinis-pini]
MKLFKMLFYSQIASALSPNGSKTLRIGMSVAFSTEEDYYATAINALYLRIQQMNDRLDLIDADTKLELYHLENDEQTSNILRAGVEFIKSDVLAIIGTGWSSLTDLLLLVTRNSQIPVCDGGSTSPILSNKAKYPNFFRTVPQDSAQAVAIVGFIKSHGWKKIGIIHSNEPYGIGLATQTTKIAKSTGIQILSKISYQPYSDQLEYPDLLNQLKVSDARIILLYCATEAEYLRFVELARIIGIYGDGYVWIGPDGLLSITDPGGLLDGSIGFFPVEAQGPESEKFANYYLENRLNTSYQYNYLSNDDGYSSYQYFYASCIDLIVLGFDQLLKSNQTFTVDNMLNRKLHKYLNIPKSFNFPDYYTPSGRIMLDASGDRKGDYHMMNFVSSDKVLVGKWENGKYIKYKDIVYSGGTTEIPSDGIIPEKIALYISFTDTFPIMILLIFLILLMIISRLIFLDLSNLISGKMIDKVRFLQLITILIFSFKLISPNGIQTATQCTIDNVIPAFCCSFYFSLCIASHKNSLTQRVKKVNALVDTCTTVQKAIPWIVPTIAILLYWNVYNPPTPTATQAGYRSYVWVCASSSHEFSDYMHILLYVYNAFLLLLSGIRIVKTFQRTRGQTVIDLSIVCVLNTIIVASVEVYNRENVFRNSSSYLKTYYIKMVCITEVLVTHLVVLHFNKENSEKSANKNRKMQSVKDSIRKGNSSFLNSTKNTLYRSKIDRKPLKGIMVFVNDSQSYKSIFIQPQQYLLQISNPTSLYLFKDTNGVLNSSGIIWESESLKSFECELIDLLTMSINIEGHIYVLFFKETSDATKVVEYFDGWKDKVEFNGYNGFE